MGNQHGKLTLNGEVYDVNKVEEIILQLKSQVDEYKKQNEEHVRQLEESKEQLESKIAEVTKLHEELDKVKSVLQQKVMRGKPDILSTVQEEVILAKQKTKKDAVSGESLVLRTATIDLKHHEKDLSSKNLIKTALKENDFLKNLDKNQMHAIVSCMKEKSYKQGEYIIKENEPGDDFFVSAM
ncbi:hypothetical protein EB796_019190 [Bugula neritina]|uniref:cAMP-dependent protein kinase type II-alpha regulatory subunit n=1 Tax=Bugula neritina TaxID=10212 RepID=A0A7J7JA07_BUGNE|nr:hypothetical protein EB796_019190 [Bugula neritina]